MRPSSQNRSVEVRVAKARASTALGMVRTATMMPVAVILRELGVDPVQLLAEFGLDAAYLNEPENRIPLTTMGRILARSAQCTNCPHFGLLVGQRDGLPALGIVGYLLQTAPDVRTSLAMLSRYIHLHNQDSAISVARNDGFVGFQYSLRGADFEGRDHILDGAAAVVFNIMRTLCGSEWHPAEVRFAHAQPGDLEPFRRFFRAPLRFDAGATAVLFADSWLDRAPRGADPMLHQILLERLAETAPSGGDGLVAQLRNLLPELVKQRHASPAHVAKLLGIGDRTLGRRLAAAGTSYVQLREEARHAVATQLLEGTRMPAQDIADQLGYAAPTSFSRAFRRWTGMGPAQWRASKHRPSRRNDQNRGSRP